MARSTRSAKAATGPSAAAVAEAEFKVGRFAPVYLVFGDEERQKGLLQDALIASAILPTERDFNLDIVYGNETTADAAIGLCMMMPMMAARRVVIVRNFEELEGNERFVTYAERPNPTAVVMLVCRGKPNMTMNPYRALKSRVAAIGVEQPKAREMARWIQDQAKRQGATIETRAAQMLADIHGTDAQAVVIELDKLTTYSGGSDRITANDIVGASGQTREHNVFALQSAVAGADYRLALEIAERLLRQAANPQGEAIKLVAILSGFLTKLWILSECQGDGAKSKELAARIGISPYYIQEYEAGLRYYRGDRMREAFAALLAADFELKGGEGGTTDPRLVVNLMLRKIVPPRR